MATKNPTRVSGSSSLVQIFRWDLTTANDVGAAIGSADSELSDRSVQVFGDPGGGTVVWQGTSDPAEANWETLTTTGGAPANFSDHGIKQILESTLYARPVLLGSLGANCSVIAVCRKPTRG